MWRTTCLGAQPVHTTCFCTQKLRAESSVHFDLFAATVAPLFVYVFVNSGDLRKRCVLLMQTSFLHQIDVYSRVPMSVFVVCRMDKEEPTTTQRPLPKTRVMRLFDITQIAAARVVDIRNVLPLLQFAHLTRAHLLHDICMQVRPLPPPPPNCPPFSCDQEVFSSWCCAELTALQTQTQQEQQS